MERIRASDSSSLPRSARPRAPPPLAIRTAVTTNGNQRLQRHVSPRKFHALEQQQRAAVLRAMPLSPLTARVGSEQLPSSRSQRNEPMRPAVRPSVPWHPVWLPDASFATASSSAVDVLLRAAGATSDTAATTVGTMMLADWLERYERSFLQFESLEQLAHVKLPEARAFIAKLEQQNRELASIDGAGSPSKRPKQPTSRVHERLRLAVYAHLVERTVFALAESPALAHAKHLLFETRQELFRALFADYDAHSSDCSHEDDGDVNDDSSDDAVSSDDASEARPTRNKEQGAPSRYGPTTAPRTLAFFVALVPFALQVRADVQTRQQQFKQHDVVLRRIVQSLYQSLASVFHAWKQLVQRVRAERLETKGAQVTAMVVQQRGRVRAVFVAWRNVTLCARIQALQLREHAFHQQHEQAVADLRRDVFLLRARNSVLEHELAAAQRVRAVANTLESSSAVADSSSDSDSDINDTTIDRDAIATAGESGVNVTAVESSK